MGNKPGFLTIVYRDFNSWRWPSGQVSYVLFGEFFAGGRTGFLKAELFYYLLSLCLQNYIREFRIRTPKVERSSLEDTFPPPTLSHTGFFQSVLPEICSSFEIWGIPLKCVVGVTRGVVIKRGNAPKIEQKGSSFGKDPKSILSTPWNPQPPTSLDISDHPETVNISREYLTDQKCPALFEWPNS